MVSASPSAGPPIQRRSSFGAVLRSVSVAVLVLTVGYFGKKWNNMESLDAAVELFSGWRRAQVQWSVKIGQKLGLPSWCGFWSVDKPTGKFHSSFPTAEQIENEANELLPLLSNLQSRKFFRIFRVDLEKECPFWARQDLCSSPTGACSVCECDKDQVPLPWKMKPIQHFVDRDHLQENSMIGGFDASAITDSFGETAASFLDHLAGRDLGGRSTYVDLSLNPPGFTNYRGRSIWGLVYKENCLATNQPECAGEEDLFRRVISGLQTAVMVLAAEFNQPFNSTWLVPFTSENRIKPVFSHMPQRHWYNMDLFRKAVAGHKEWIENLYMDFSLLLRTLHKTRNILSDCDCYTGSEIEDGSSRTDLDELLNTIAAMPSIRIESTSDTSQPLFLRRQDEAIRLLHNISSIFDCVECEKCRLHGKIKLAALQIAVKANGNEPLRTLERNEVVALVNALGYFAEAVFATVQMEKRASAFRELIYLLTLLGGFVVGSLLLLLYCIYLDSVRAKIQRARNEIETAAAEAKEIETAAAEAKAKENVGAQPNTDTKAKGAAAPATAETRAAPRKRGGRKK